VLPGALPLMLLTLSMSGSTRKATFESYC